MEKRTALHMEVTSKNAEAANSSGLALIYRKICLIQLEPPMFLLFCSCIINVSYIHLASSLQKNRQGHLAIEYHRIDLQHGRGL